jgi:hypothetical protein
MTWDYEGTDVIYFPCEEERKYHIDIAQLLEDVVEGDPHDLLCQH